jgi:penicillin amidase
MTNLQTPIDFAGACSQLDGELRLPGLQGSVHIIRDAFGVPHIRAMNEHDAWFGQGFTAAQDRLWQMEYDRRRAAGRWAEAAGPVAVAADRLSRRLQLARSAQGDIGAMSTETRAMFEAYAAGVNAFLRSGQPLPVEYALSGIEPEPWEPWHSLAAFKIRHVLMGVWQRKLAEAQLLATIGSEAYAKLDARPPLGSPVILPPDGAVAELFEQGVDDVAAAAEQLGFLAEVEAGSNSWAVHGSLTTTGMPVLCNDSHRALDVPNVYWQAHVACPDFDVIGATFPGLPAFPHFGHNGHVAWNITHASADYQDLYMEQFDTNQHSRYRVPEGWAVAEREEQTIAVRGAAPVAIEVWRTRHGPIVHGDPRRGVTLALRYTATDGPCRGFEALRPMLTARTVAELHEAQREWVDPVNNLVSADDAGNIGYLTRGYLPVRSSEAHRVLPAPGWTGEHEWTGRVPFEELPQAINPPEGFIATANQRIIPGDTPYISQFFAVPARAERIREQLTAQERLTPAEIIALQGDTTSRPARSWARLFARSGPFTGEAELARAMLAGWDENLLPDSAEALLYACARRLLARTLFEPVVGEQAWRWLTSMALPPTGTMIGQWLANVVAELDGRCSETTPDGRRWGEVLPSVLASAWQAARQRGGDDPSAWKWAAVHRTNARHTLAATLPDLGRTLDPPRAAVGGDADTLQCASFALNEAAAFDITSLSVYRQTVDLTDIAGASFVVPGGVSGLPGTPHYADQLDLWRRHERIPMHYQEDDVLKAAEHTLTLAPGV